MKTITTGKWLNNLLLKKAAIDMKSSLQAKAPIEVIQSRCTFKIRYCELTEKWIITTTYDHK
jgi:hypothetical protein